MTGCDLFLEREAVRPCRELTGSVRHPIKGTSQEAMAVVLWEMPASLVGCGHGDGQEGKKDVRSILEEELTGHRGP